MKYDYAAAIEYLTQPSSLIDHVLVEKAVLHALAEMQRMQDDGLVAVPRAITQSMLAQGLNAAEKIGCDGNPMETAIMRTAAIYTAMVSEAQLTQSPDKIEASQKK